METELKFQVPPAARAALLAAMKRGPTRTTRLQAVYAETADRRLAAHGMALRLRQEGRTWVQTLKGRGDGLMNRLEHEVPLPRQRGMPALDVQRHAGTAVGDRLMALLDGEALQPLYRTDIRRLHGIAQCQGLRVEVAYDRGWLLADGGPGEATAPRRLAVDEIELELLSGPPPLLVGYAITGVVHHGLWWDCRTKSERGMRLALGMDRVPATVAAARRPVRSFTGWQAAVADALSHALPNAAEIANGLGSADHARELGLALKRLQAVLRMASAGPHAESAARLAVSLSQLQGKPGWAVRDPGFNVLMLAALGLSLPLPADEAPR